MTSICLSTSFVSLLRRLINAFSVFSISQQYAMSKKVVFGTDPGGSVHDPDAQENENDQESHIETPHESTGGADPNDPSPRSETQGQTDKDNGESFKHNPQLFDSARAPRHPIVLCHGLYGFDVRGPESFPMFRMHYWSNVMSVLKKVGAEVVVTGVPGTASISSRAERMDQFLQTKVKGRDINFVAHSMGGLDCRHLITHLRPKEYRSLSLTSLSVPHRGSPFMDWCMANIGIGLPRPFPFPSTASSQPTPQTPQQHKRTVPYSLSSPLLSPSSPQNDTKSSSKDPTSNSNTMDPPPSESTSTSASKLITRLIALNTLQALPSSFTSLILSLIDSPAYSNLTTSFLRDSFNPLTPDDPNVKYFSIAARVHKLGVWHPLWFPKMIVDAAEELEMAEEERESGFISQLQGQGHELTLSYPPKSDIRRTSRVDSDLNTLGTTALRGNDGLVPIQSAKWGEFLGVIDGCNHWDIRGAGSTSRSASSSGVDTSRSGQNASGSGLGLNRIGLDFDWEEGWKVWRDWVSAVSGTGDTKEEKLSKERATNAIQTSAGTTLSSHSTAAVSSQYDVHQNVNTKSSDSTTMAAQITKVQPKLTPKDPTWTSVHGLSDNGHRFDLERFYVALCRKLYDEGL